MKDQIANVKGGGGLSANQVRLNLHGRLHARVAEFSSLAEMGKQLGSVKIAMDFYLGKIAVEEG